MNAALPATEEAARAADADDPGWRDHFVVPPAEGGHYAEAAYLVGNSLGLQPKAAPSMVLDELDSWAKRGVEGFFEGDRPWLPNPQQLAESAARLVGALPRETVVMNSLTVNLHLLMVSFYRPHGERTRILIEDTAFPSDSYAVRSQARFHGLDPDQAVVRLRARTGEQHLRTEDIVDLLAREGHTYALVLLGGVNYQTGQLMDIPAITRAGQAAGAVVGWDLAHAAGNVPLHLHDWGVDFAAWCTYKYLNSGPGAPGAAFIHERHLRNRDLQRFEGWWGTDVQTRFLMEPVSQPPESADAWQISTPCALALAPMRAALDVFDKAGMATLRERSLRLTGYLAGLIEEITPGRPITMITPHDPAQRGSQLSLRVTEGTAGELVRRLRSGHGVMTDAREPDVVRVAPAALYSTYHDCWRFADALTHVFPSK
ncbi:kynureninase [Phytoactinopolyspora mesophila]|uniref:Kynureninase n=1 Tax=Phytoactinopolyspora mesophila TaxID=2650750 RepID=A0A7K3M4U9_9ACTN|nr:kynureninase [Phytoactinopolyspora mesophila]NDL58276.1 kynureninase [Phytoactinopolyspora mesophila]